jgi:hypothetical protein
MHQPMHKMKVLDNSALLDGTLVLMNQFFFSFVDGIPTVIHSQYAGIFEFSFFCSHM